MTVSEGATGTITGEETVVNGDLSGTAETLVVDGGHFEKDPSAYVKDGYVAIENPAGGYDVKKGKSIFETTITVAYAGAYDGTGKEPAVTVMTNGVAIAATDGYTLSYSSNTNAGTATVAVAGIGEWINSTNVTFQIAKAQVSVKAKDLTVPFRTPVEDVVYEFDYDSFVGDDTAATVLAEGMAPAVTCAYTAVSAAGSEFVITVDVSGLVADNYEFVASETKGVLKVGAAEAPTMLETTAITVAGTTVTLRHRLLEGAKYYTYFTATSLTNEWKAAADSRTLGQLTVVTVQPEGEESYSAGEWTFTGVDDPVRFYQVGYSSVPFAEGDAMGEKPAEGGDEP